MAAALRRPRLAEYNTQAYAAQFLSRRSVPMPSETPEVETILTDQMSRAEALAIAKLIVRVWPKPGVTEDDRADTIQTNRGDKDPPTAIASRSVVIREGDVVIGHAVIFPRTVGTSGGPMTIAALGSVCTAPEYRGQQLGGHLVRAAWQMLEDPAVPFSLFQTSERASQFYLRMGATFVDNRIVDSMAEDPQRNPFKDDHVMRYPATGRWPAGEIDLRGHGY